MFETLLTFTVSSLFPAATLVVVFTLASVLVRFRPVLVMGPGLMPLVLLPEPYSNSRAVLFTRSASS